MHSLPVHVLLLAPLLLVGVATVFAADVGGPAKGAPPGDAPRSAFLAYKLRETGQQASAPLAAAAGAAKAGEQEKPDALVKQIEKFNQEKKKGYRSISYGSQFAQGSFAAPGK